MFTPSNLVGDVTGAGGCARRAVAPVGQPSRRPGRGLPCRTSRVGLRTADFGRGRRDLVMLRSRLRRRRRHRPAGPDRATRAAGHRRLPLLRPVVDGSDAAATTSAGLPSVEHADCLHVRGALPDDDQGEPAGDERCHVWFTRAVQVDRGDAVVMNKADDRKAAAAGVGEVAVRLLASYRPSSGLCERPRQSVIAIFTISHMDFGKRAPSVS